VAYLHRAGSRLGDGRPGERSRRQLVAACSLWVPWALAMSMVLEGLARPPARFTSLVRGVPLAAATVVRSSGRPIKPCPAARPEVAHGESACQIPIQ
jgi:hypothetical protein